MNPAWVSVVYAREYSTPTTFGTSTSATPLDTVSAILVPGGRFDPAFGLIASTSSLGRSEFL